MTRYDQFKKLKNDLVEHVNLLKAVVQDDLNSFEIRKLDDFSQELKRQLVFTVLCVGDFSSGKTTFVNRFLIEEDLLPTKVTPTTARLTEVRYGDVLKAHIISGDAEVQSISEDVKESLAAFIVKDGKYTDTTERVIIETPSQSLSEGVVVVDAPGLNDPDLERMKVTLDYLHQADAVLYFFNAQQAWTKSQKEFLEESVLGKKELDKLFLMLNYWDCVDQDQRDELLEHVQFEMKKSMTVAQEHADHLDGYLSIPELIPISAKTGEGTELVREKIWDYLSKSKGDVLGQKIHRFNQYVEGYSQLVEERSELAKQDLHEIARRENTLKKDLARYRELSESALQDLRLRLEPELDEFRCHVDTIFEQSISAIRNELNEDCLMEAVKLGRFVVGRLSNIESRLKSQLLLESSKLGKAISCVVRSWKGQLNVPIKKVSIEDDCFGDWASGITDKDKLDDLLGYVQIAGAGAVAGGFGLGVYAIAQTAGGLAKLGAMFSTAASFSLTVLSGGIMIGGAAIYGLIQRDKEKRRREYATELYEKLLTQMQVSKDNYLLQLSDGENSMMNAICDNVHHDSINAYIEKQSELEAISCGDVNIEGLLTVKQRLRALKMAV